MCEKNMNECETAKDFYKKWLRINTITGAFFVGSLPILPALLVTFKESILIVVWSWFVMFVSIMIVKYHAYEVTQFYSEKMITRTFRPIKPPPPPPPPPRRLHY